MGFGEWPPTPPPEQEQHEDPPPSVPEHEMEFDFARSSGAGGQNVNKRDTKAMLRWNIGASQTFTDEQKALIRAYAGSFLKQGDYIQIFDQTTRSQGQNKANAIEKLQQLVAEALTPVKERKETKVSRAQKAQRLEDKRRDADRKKDRKPPRGDW